MGAQQRLQLAVEAVAITCTYVHLHGWTCTISSRRQGEEWGKSHRVHYSHLTSAELEDVLSVELGDALGG